MKTEWDYSALAGSYRARADYSEVAVRDMLSFCLSGDANDVCDIGAGTGHLTRHIASYGHKVVAVEPNDGMRSHGMRVTSTFSNVRWHEATAESTGLDSRTFDLVSFGSSFNVCDQSLALRESERILRSSGWFACMWNHRVLEDPLQKAIESAIRSRIEDYDYGSRRQDPTEVIKASGYFSDVRHIAAATTHSQTLEECVEAWRSHATLQRQSGAKFEAILAEIEEVLTESISGGAVVIEVPYVTRIWFAQRASA